MIDNDTQRAKLAGLAAFADMFLSPGFSFGYWEPAKRSSDNLSEFGYYCYSDEADAFQQAMYDLGWVTMEFDWPMWKAKPEAEALYANPARFERATAEELGHMLTTLIRLDRFCEGALGEAFKDGVLTAIVLRARALLDGSQA